MSHMHISKELTDELKEIYKEKEGKDLSDQEADKMASDLVGFFDILWTVSQRQARLDRRLRKEPDGFPVDGNYSCLICHNSITEVNGWYHWGGQRCLLCHKAIKEGVIPAYVLKHRNSYFSKWELQDKFGVKPQSVKKLIREGKITARAILNENGSVHEYLFLKEDNPHIFDRYTPVRKSYDRHRAKESRKWSREQAKKLKAELRETRRRKT